MTSAFWHVLAVQLHNRLFAGGLALAFTGTLVATVAATPHLLRRLILRWWVVAVHVDTRSELFEQTLAWLNDHHYAQACRRLSARLVTDSDEQKRIEFTPAPGWHWFWHQRRLLWLERQEQKTQSAVIRLSGGSERREGLTIRSFGRRSELLRQLLGDIQCQHDARTKDQLRIYAVDGYNEWVLTARARKRPLQSVILAGGQAEDILQDIQQFRASQSWYAERGIPWRRGYLLYGPPGTGKTSLVRAIASTFSLDLAMLNIASDKLDDIMLTTLMVNSPQHCIMLFEDIDAAFVDRNAQGRTGISFSGLLNAIDGVMSQEGHMLFMTTNHPERLDQALIRPGRIDRRLELGTATTEQIVRHYRLYFPDASAGECEAFVQRLKGQVLTSARVQEMLLELLIATEVRHP